jgi:predicted esterase
VEPDSPGLLQIRRTWFGVYDSLNSDGARGVALVMPGLFNTPEPIIEYVVKALQERGWVVLRMMAQPSRFTERVEFAINPDRLDDSARRLAGEMQDRVAECAFAAQAAFGHLLSRRPELGRLPRIALGMSGGAMTLPTVVAREPEKYAGAVLIAGGADLYAITSESNYRAMIGSLTYKWLRPPTEAEKDQLDRLYLEHATLDSYHTAAALRGKPVLMIHGTHDGAVPARLGDLLWERLGRPERWSEEAGHEEVFMRLPQKTGRILEWLDQKVPAPKPP